MNTLLKAFRPIDNFIDGITMYRLLLYYLIGLVLAAIGLSAIGDMHYSALNIALSSSIAVLACWIINKIFGYIFNAPINPESSLLTGLILSLIIAPTTQNFGILFILAASGLAMASKYILTIGEKHIFNPAAIAVVLTALGPRQSADWWVGTAAMLPFVIIGGILITRKTRRESMVITFLIVTSLATAILAILGHTSAIQSLSNMVTSSAAFFLGFVMLTEPYSSPTTRGKQLLYAGIVGFLLAPQVHLGHTYTSPEIALVVGNVFAYIVSPKTKLFPTLSRKFKIARDTVEFDFLPGRKLKFKPGQYMEFTLPHDSPDNRGSRRWFTIASSPTEKTMKLGVKFYKESSSYKRAMLDMDQNTPMVAAQVAGDFTLPKDKSKKLVFIAGGIGVTPFRSMTKYLIDTNEKRSVRMLYGARTIEDLAYRDVFEAAHKAFNMQTLYVLDEQTGPMNGSMVKGKISKELIVKCVPDYEDCMFFISGTHPMVEAVQFALGELGVHHRNIKIDFFPGYV